jgi:hypothetical protein
MSRGHPQRRWAAFFAFICGLFRPPGVSAIELTPSQKLQVTHTILAYDNRITGSNKAGSFLTPGSFFTDDLGLVYSFTRGEDLFEAAADGRAADDDRIQTKRFLLKNASLKLTTTRHDAAVGDVLANFSQYTLNTSIKGARYTFKSPWDLDFTVLGGYDKPEWDDAWNHNTSENLDRRYLGARVVKRFKGEASLGLSAVYSKDHRAHYNTSSDLDSQRIFGVDWALPPLGGLKLSGESALSRTDMDRAQSPFGDPDEMTEDPALSDASKHGFAHLVKADYTRGRFKSNNAFERVSPRYATNGGASSPDLVRVNTENTMDIVGPWKWVMFNYTYFHDGLEHDGVKPRNTTRMPESGFRYDGPDWRPTFALEGKLRLREVTDGDTGHRTRMRSVISTLADRLGPLSGSVDYEFQHEDVSDGSMSQRHHILGVTGACPVEFKGWKATPGARWNLQRDRDNLVPSLSQTGQFSGTLTLETPWGVDAGGGWSRNLVLVPDGNGSDRRTTSASLGWNILKNPDNRLEFKFKQNDNRFEQPDQDFKEMIFQGSLATKF